MGRGSKGMFSGEVSGASPVAQTGKKRQEQDQDGPRGLGNPFLS